MNRDTNHIYDLRPIARGAWSNWEAEEYVYPPYSYQSAPKRKYHFNVCKKLNAVPLADGGYICPKGSYACVTSSENPGQMGESLGRHLETIVFGDDGTIAIKYRGGDKCPPQKDQRGNATRGESQPKFKSSLVTLACTPNAHETPQMIKK